MSTNHLFSLAGLALAAAALGGCAGVKAPAMMTPAAPTMAAAVPAAVQVPPGHMAVLETVGAGDITYECREKTGMTGEHEWAFVGPSASLVDRQGRTVGRYFGPPATWAAADGSAITGTQLAVAPAGMGNIPLQLVKAAPATGSGLMSGVSHVQRVATRGGVAPASACTAEMRGRREVVRYQADYIFWKPV